MSKLIFLTIVILLFCKCSECCDLLKYKHSPTGKVELYEKLESRKMCNGMPIYKMVDDLFFMYKLAKSNYWCNSYIPSKIVICQAECDEIRFDFDGVTTNQGAIPQEFISTYHEWIPLANQAIVCNDEEYTDDVVVYDDLITSPAIENNETLVFNTTVPTVSKNKTHEMLLDEVLLNVKTTQNNQTETVERNKTEEEIQDEMIRSENEYIILKVLQLNEEMRMNEIRDDLINQFEVPTTTTTTTAATTTNKPTKIPEIVSRTVSNVTDEDNNEDKYIVAMILKFSSFDKRNARPTDEN